MRFGIIVFPGTWAERDFHHALTNVLGQEAEYVWHKNTDLSRYDAIILPGGFSYGDYLRVGAIARFSPVMKSVEEFAANGGLVFGSCNGFQILCEARILPGAVLRSVHLKYMCQWTHLRVENTKSPFAASCQKGQVLNIPISHYEGRYYADEATLADIEANGQVLLRYSTPSREITPEANPNGSLNNIAGITNKAGNIVGMMPHPERCCELILGGVDGRVFFESIAV